MGCSPNVARLLTQLTTFEGHLAQGSPASTAIANLLLSDFDERVAAEAAVLEVSVSRVVDDVVVSGGRNEVGAMIDFVVRELYRLGLRPNRRKIHRMGRGGRQLVCNLVVSEKVAIPSRPARRGKRCPGLTRHELRSRVRHAQKFGISRSDRARLEGQLHYARHMHPDFATGLLRKLDAAETAS